MKTLGPPDRVSSRVGLKLSGFGSGFTQSSNSLVGQVIHFSGRVFGFRVGFLTTEFMFRCLEVPTLGVDRPEIFELGRARALRILY